MKYDPVRDGTVHGQWHFDFKDWEAAFELFYRKKRMDAAYCLVISVHDVTSGYWVERGAKTDEYNRVYRSVTAVKSLEARVRERRAAVESLSLGGVVL
jgi:hypothetical protein